MDLIKQLIDFVLHIDKHLAHVVADYRSYTYIILFLVIFAETGLVIFPFLPGDSLLFAMGALIAHGTTGLDIHLMALLLFVAAVVGNVVNYFIGQKLGQAAFNGNSRFFKREHYDKAHAFFEKHGNLAVIFSRFMPIVRTIAPFVAGVSKMPMRRFMVTNVIGAFAWVYLFLYGGYWLSSIPFFKERFSLVIGLIVLITLLPAIVGAVRGMFGKKKVE